MHKNPRIRIPVEVRKYVYQRDNYQCKNCGQTHHDTQLSIDHIIPLARSGTNDISNLQTLCLTCNQQKKDKIVHGLRRYFDSESKIDC
ncbi:MAG: HNH endonuclease [Fischerella sp. CENA71]|nr:HNH endonuclease [Fischerella sp. CENA71]